MPDYDVISGPEESERAPRGVCEISIQIITNDAFAISGRFENLINEHISNSFTVEAYEMEGVSEGGRLVVYTGSDRLDVGEVREVAELYASASGFERGNIPPNMSVFTSRNELDSNVSLLWLEFKLQDEMPLDEVKDRLTPDIGNVDISPKRPQGTDLRAIKFREKNYAYDTVRELTATANDINDNLPVEFIQLVCGQ